MRLQPRPSFRAGASLRFPSFFDGARAVRAVAQAGLYPPNYRILDAQEAFNTGATDGSGRSRRWSRTRPAMAAILKLVTSGTISGESKGSFGSLLEIAKRGQTLLGLPTSEQRVFLEDGDEVTFRGFCARAGFARIGFGTVSPARERRLIPAA
jgi:hypothetical protein